MPISDALLAEFDQEMANTRKTLERVPQDKFGWKPHDKSFTMCEMASHLANIPSWTPMTLEQDSFKMSTEEHESFSTPQAESTEHLVKMFDENVEAARKSIANCSDEEFQKTWTMLMDDKELFAMPKIAVMRSFIMNHAIHHRAQLTMYFRLNDVPVPALYGPSADEQN